MAAAKESSKTIKESEIIAVAKIEQHGTALTIPEGMKINQAIELLQRRLVYDEETVAVSRNYEVFPYDGAVALDAILAKRYGWSAAVPTPGFFTMNPPKTIGVEVAYGVTKQVPWGAFMIPGVDGYLQTGAPVVNGRRVFQLSTEVKRKWEKDIIALYDEIEDYLETNSIYRGKAFKLDFARLSNDGYATPQFLDTDSIDTDQPVFSTAVADAIETNIYTPLIRFKDMLKAKLPVKRSTLLAGTYGTGKTLVARVAAKHAVDASLTCIICPDAKYLAHAVAFAKMYERPGVLIFCEDIDRSTEGTRTAEMDAILNIVDGIDSKNSRIMMVLTTNAAESINQAMLRPGRLDAVIDVLPPDSEAIQKLLRKYGHGVINEDEDLSAVGDELSGNIPAVIEEVVKRSKLAMLKRAPVGTYNVKVSAEALLESAHTMKMQLNLLNRKSTAIELPTLDAALKAMVTEAVTTQVKPIQLTQDKTHRNVMTLGEGVGISLTKFTK